MCGVGVRLSQWFDSHGGCGDRFRFGLLFWFSVNRVISTFAPCLSLYGTQCNVLLCWIIPSYYIFLHNKSNHMGQCTVPNATTQQSEAQHRPKTADWQPTHPREQVQGTRAWSFYQCIQQAMVSHKVWPQPFLNSITLSWSCSQWFTHQTGIPAARLLASWRSATREKSIDGKLVENFPSTRIELGPIS